MSLRYTIAVPFRALRVGGTLILAMLASTALHAQTVSLDDVAPIALSSTETAVQIDALTGNVVVNSDVSNYNSCTRPTPVTPTITSFFATNPTVTPGSTITLNWTSSNATFCTPSLGAGTTWSGLGNLPANGSQNLIAPSTTGPLNFQLVCSDGSPTRASSAPASLQVNVQSAGGNCLPTYPTGVNVAWTQIFGQWPTYSARRLLNVTSGYLAIQFTTPATTTPAQYGTFAGFDHPNDGGGYGILSISRDAGCFNGALLPPNCVTTAGRFPSISWTQGNGPFQCQLQGGQSYFINISYGNTTLPGSGPYCPAGVGQCSHEYQNTQQD